MPTYFVGPGGNDANNGLTWALRKLTLNGAEDIPVVAGDIVIAGPGVYRETLTIDVHAAIGNRITYIADVTGENTDGVGGIVRITGSNNDQTAARNVGIDAVRNYRTFRGFYIDTCIQRGIQMSYATGSIIEDCVIMHNPIGIDMNGEFSADCIVRRCLIIYNNGASIQFWDGQVEDNNNHLIENCILGITASGSAIAVTRTGGITVRDCLINGDWRGVNIAAALSVGQSVTVNNCILTCNFQALAAINVGEIIENFNNFYGNGADRVNVNVGANSVAYSPILQPPILYSGVGQLSGFKFPWWFGELSEWSQIQAITGLNEPTEDLKGILRPVTVSKNSWGPNQFFDMEREIGTVRTGLASLVLHDAGRHPIWVPVTATPTTFEIYVYREANYAGLLPQMVIKQPGQADRVTTDVGVAGAWNLLTDMFTPAALPPYVVVELVSRNTAVALAYETFFDDLNVL